MRQARLLLCALLLALLAAAPGARAAERPDVQAPSAIVMETSTGDVAYAKDADARRPIASTTKLMTTLLVLEGGGLKQEVTAPRYRGSAAESVLPLVPGEEMTVADLLRALLLRSANDAAVALAVHEAGSVPSFVRQMNRRAAQLGMRNTHFGNPIGLDTGDNYSSARDLARLTLVLRKDRFFRRTVNSAALTLRSGARQRAIENRNTLLDRFGWVDGVKTGHTSAAGWCMVSSGRKRGVSVVAVELGAPSEAARDDVSVSLLNYGLSRYRVRGVTERGSVEARIPIEDRAGATLPVVASRSLRRVVRKGDRVTYRRELPKTVAGPIATGDEVGKLAVAVRGRDVAAVPLRAMLPVPAASPARKVQDSVLGPWTLLVLGGALLGGAALAALRRGPGGRRPRREVQGTEAT